MRAVIIGNGSVSSYEEIKKYIGKDDFVICADGGIRHAIKMGVRPNLVIGDFDSSNPDAAAVDAERIQYPTRKDYTDGELCVKYAAEHGYDDVLMIGMIGTRIDHTINNLLMLSQCKNGMAVNEKNEIYYLKDSLELNNKNGKTLSIIPLKGDMKGITTKGLEYALNDGDLFFGESKGNSNEIISDECKITVKSGEGLVIVNDGE